MVVPLLWLVCSKIRILSVNPKDLPRRRRQHPHIVLADGFDAVSPFSMPRRRREPSHIVLADVYSPSGWMNYA